MNEKSLRRILGAAAIAALLAACGRDDPARFVTSAEAYLAKDNYPAAIIELKNALAKEPDHARARFLLAKALLDSGDPIAAATEFRKALALKYSPDDVYPLLARALVAQPMPKKEFLELANAPVQSPHAKAEIAAMLAAAHAGLGERKEAREQVDAALALEPANVSARIVRAQLTALDGDLPGAMQEVDAVLASAPDSVEALMLKADIDVAQGRRAEAIKTYERVLALRPATIRARYALIAAFVQAKDLARADPHVEAVRKAAPNDVRTLHAIALVAYARGDNATALEAIQKAVQAAPEYPPVRYLSGLVDLKRGAYANAEQSLRIVVAQSPNDDGARIALAEAYLRRDQAAKAEETLAPVLRRVPDNTTALRLAGEIALALKRLDQSAEYLARANAIDRGDIGSQVRIAEVRLAKGDTGTGVRDLEALAATGGDRAEPDLALINAHLRTRDFAKALAAADALVKKQPSSPVAHNARGVVLLAKGDLKGGREAFEKAVALDPGFVTAAVNLARLDGVERNFAGAKQRYDQILAKDPKSAAALLGLAELQIASQAAPADVAAAIQRAINANPELVPARLMLINHYARLKDWKSALAAAQAAQAAIPDTPAILEALATVHQAAGERNQAIEIYSRLARFQPDNPLPHMRIAAIQAELKNYGAAIAALKTAMGLAPDNAAIAIALAAAYMEANQPDAGFAEARRVQKQLPGKATGYGLEAELFAAQKKLPEAVAAYRAGLARQPNAIGVTRTHMLLTLLGKPDEASSVAQKWLQGHPDDVQVRGYLAQLLLAKRDYAGAIPLYKAAVEHDPNNVALLNNLAWSLSETGSAAAVEYGERAYRIAPNVPEVVNTYGWILVQNGKTEQGIALLRQSVNLVPADPEKRLLLARALLKAGDKPGARKELDLVAKGESPTARSQAEQLLKDL